MTPESEPASAPAPEDAAACVRLLRALRDGPLGADALAKAAGLPPAVLGAALDLARGAHLVAERDGRLASIVPFDALMEADVARALPEAARGAFDLDIVPATGSTNADLLAAATRLPSGHVRAAEWQIAGRGRRGRAWTARPGASLAFSVLWKFAGGAGSLAGLSLAVGVAAARALDACGAPGLKLKWPNDVLAETRDGLAKLAGILIEIAPVAAGPIPVVIGIGINVAPVGAVAGQAVTSLAELGVTLPRHAILARLLGELAPLLRGFESTGFEACRAEWNRRHAFAGREVETSGEGGAPTRGIAIGADDDGALLIDSAQGRVRVVGGEISLRAVGGDRPAPTAPA